MPKSKQVSPSVEANNRALRVLRAAGDTAVFGAALSVQGVRALCVAASAVAGATGESWPFDAGDPVAGRRPPYYLPAARLYQLALALAAMREQRVQPDDPGWGAGAVQLDDTLVRGIPSRSVPAGTRTRADAAVARILVETPAHRGLTALAVVIDSAGLPEPVVLNTHSRPLLPASLANGVSRHPRAGTVSPTLPDSYAAVGWLPTIYRRSINVPVLPLPLYELLNRRKDRRPGGHSADLALRIFVEGVTAVMRSDWRRAVDQVVLIPVTLREFLSWFYGSRIPRPNEYWPQFRAASRALDSDEARFPFDDGTTSGSLRVVSLGVIPRRARCLGDQVSIRVQLPPGSKDGPAIDRLRLREWGRTSAVAYRALLGLAYYWYQPGRTRVPRPGGGWMQSTDPDRYDPFSPDGLIALCYPTSRMARRSTLLRRSRECLKRLDAAGDIRLLGDRILPPASFAERPV